MAIILGHIREVDRNSCQNFLLNSVVQQYSLITVKLLLQDKFRKAYELCPSVKSKIFIKVIILQVQCLKTYLFEEGY